jgi:Fe-S-cluster-containing dehydrogenase component
MQKKRIVLTFPSSLVDQPITYHLVKDYNLMINILSAKVTPREEGKLVMEVSGKKKFIDEGIQYLSNLGVNIQPLAKDITWHKEKCTHCTACIAICPSGALALDRKEMLISFIKDRCIACELCIPACPYEAINIQF